MKQNYFAVSSGPFWSFHNQSVVQIDYLLSLAININGLEAHHTPHLPDPPMCRELSSFAAITETCQKYFDDVDALIVQASKTSEQAKQQMEAMKPQLEQAKKQLADLPAENQDAGCKQGADALAQMKQSMGIQ